MIPRYNNDISGWISVTDGYSEKMHESDAGSESTAAAPCHSQDKRTPGRRTSNMRSLY